MFFDEFVLTKMNEKKNISESYSSFLENDIPGIKEDIENLWDKYEKYAPEDFKMKAIETKETFYQRWWEMYLGCTLLDFGYEIETNKKDIGPDFKIIVDGEVYWIEAVAPEMGINVNKLPSIELNGEPQPLPKDNFLLRLNNAIDNKREKYLLYLNNEKIEVKNNDKKIVAISTCNLSEYGSLMDFPEIAIECLLFNKGDLTINLKTGKRGIKEKNGIILNNDKIIPTNIFEKEIIIDGIIYTNDRPLNCENKFKLYVNQNCIINNEFNNHFNKNVL